MHTVFLLILSTAECSFRFSWQGVPVVHDPDQYSTDLMKCITALEQKEKAEGSEVSEIETFHSRWYCCCRPRLVDIGDRFTCNSASVVSRDCVLDIDPFFF